MFYFVAGPAAQKMQVKIMKFGSILLIFLLGFLMFLPWNVGTTWKPSVLLMCHRNMV
jgi:hypothetical protein